MLTLIVPLITKPTLTMTQFHIDGYKPVHDPSEKATTEPTTGRKLNILDVPKSSSAATKTSSRHSKRESMDIPKGRSLSPSRIVHPKPSKPYESRHVREADYSTSPSVGMEDICDKLEQASLYKVRNVSPASSVASSLSSRSSGGSSLSSLSNPSDSSSECRCNKYGVTRKGDRVKLDCGGRLCGYSDDSDSCSSIESDSESEEEQVQQRRPRYQESKPRYQEIAPRRSAATSDRRRR